MYAYGLRSVFPLRIKTIRVKRLLAGLAILGIFSLGAAPQAASLTFQEFDRLDTVQKENFVSTVLHFYYYTYQSNPAAAQKVRCMRSLGEKEMANGESYLLHLTSKHIEVTRATASRSRVVEQMIQDLIDRECTSF